MPASISAGTPVWIDFDGMTGQNPLRTYEVGTRVLNLGNGSQNQVPGGVFPGGGAMAVGPGGGQAVTVAAGYCCVPNSSSSLQGGYVFGTMTQVTLSVATADPVNPRIDAVLARVYDNGNSTSFCDAEVVTGTPNASPSAPGAVPNSIVLATVTVPAGSASVSSSSISDQRAFVVAPGGILPIPNSAAAPAVPASQFLYDIATNQLCQGTGTAGSVSVVGGLPWAPVMAAVTSAVSDSLVQGALTEIANVSFTVDGNTDVDIYLKWPGWETTHPPVALTILAQIDGTTVDQTDLYVTSAAFPVSGGSVHYFTSAAQGNTPAAGTHTASWWFQSASTASVTTLTAGNNAVALLRVTPVAQ